MSIVVNGRHPGRLLEPEGLTVSREYVIQWKKQSYNTAELARLRFEEKLGSRRISQIMGIPRTTAIMAVRRLEKIKGVNNE